MSNVFSRKLATLSPLSIEHQHDLANLIGTTRSIDAHRNVTRTLNDVDVLRVVMKGWVGQHRILRNGRRQIVRLLLPGDVIEPNASSIDAMGYSMFTFTQASLSEVSVRKVFSLGTSSPEIAEAFRRQMLEITDIQREWIVSIGRRTALERAGHLFCEVTARLAAIGLSDGLECEMPLTQTDLADIFGITNVHVNRVLHDLRTANLVAVRRRRLTIVNPQALAEMAMFDPGYLHRRSA